MPVSFLKYCWKGPLLAIMALALGIGVPTLVSAAISNGMNASDLLGQYDDSSPTSPSPVYTKSAANNVPKRKIKKQVLYAPDIELVKLDFQGFSNARNDIGRAF
jgi:hypothetical protein